MPGRSAASARRPVFPHWRDLVVAFCLPDRSGFNGLSIAVRVGFVLGVVHVCCWFSAPSPRCPSNWVNPNLHRFDRLFYRKDGPAHWAKAKLVRYAEELLVLGWVIRPRLRQWIEGTLEWWL